MGISKILNQLHDFFGEDKHNMKHKKQIGILLEKLKIKEEKLEKELKTEKNEHSQKTIKRSLKVIRAQIKKGNKILSS